MNNSIKGIVTDSDGLLKELQSGSASPAEIMIASGDTSTDLLATRSDVSPLVEVTRYWTVRTGDRALPGRIDINLVEIIPLVLPHIMLLDLIPGERRHFRYRLVATEVADIFGADYSGYRMDEIVPPLLQEQVQRAYLILSHWIGPF
ncbi:MAG: PAS domain-containing protein [Alphaproteobacteria bacterium]